MKTRLFFIVLTALAIGACSKSEIVSVDSNKLIGIWEVDSSIFKGYINDKLIVEDVDRNDGSETETMHFRADGTFTYYYVSMEIPNKADTTEITPGTYSFNMVTKELILKDDTRLEKATVSLLNDEHFTYHQTFIDPEDTNNPELDKEVFSFYMSKVQ